MYYQCLPTIVLYNVLALKLRILIPRMHHISIWSPVDEKLPLVPDAATARSALREKCWDINVHLIVVTFVTTRQFYTLFVCTCRRPTVPCKALFVHTAHSHAHECIAITSYYLRWIGCKSYLIKKEISDLCTYSLESNKMDMRHPHDDTQRSELLAGFRVIL